MRTSSAKPLDEALNITHKLYNKEVIDMAAAALKLDETFAALADPTRRAILRRLAAGEASVSELARPFDMSQPAISRHLKVLERAGLISTGQDAQRRPRKLEPEALVIANADNAGFGRACNQGWRASRAPLVLFLNPDAEVAPGTKVK